jgi:hypothetical protein
MCIRDRHGASRVAGQQEEEDERRGGEERRRGAGN